MIKDVLNIYKPLGLTPLEAIERYRLKHPEYADVKMGYAGRLDPLAEGVLIVLTGETLKGQKSYMELDKEYVAKIVIGCSTDTYDVLGISKTSSIPDIKENQIKEALRTYEGKQKLPFPPFSSYKIQGKPLFWWARNKKLEEINIPRTDTEVYSVELKTMTSISGKDLQKKINKKVDLVDGDFRQEEIKTTWEKNLRDYYGIEFPVLEVRVSCSSGTYIRSIANDLGKKINSGGVLLHLLRTKVGDYSAENAIRI